MKRGQLLRRLAIKDDGFRFLFDEIQNLEGSGYSLFKLRSNYTGACIELRRDSDNATMDIGFGSDNFVDTSEILSFIGSGDGSFRFYDQGLQGRDEVMSDDAHWRKIVDNGNLIVDTNGVVTSICDATRVGGTIGTVTTQANAATFMVSSISSDISARMLSITFNNIYIGYQISTQALNFRLSGSFSGSSLSQNQNRICLVNIESSTTARLFVDGELNSQTTSGSFSGATGAMGLSKQGTTTNFPLIGTTQCIGFYQNSLSQSEVDTANEILNNNLKVY